MTGNVTRALMAIAVMAAASFAAPTASGADDLKVEFVKKSTGHRRGLQYEYLFKVVAAQTGAPVDGAEFSVVGDMPEMRGHHPTRPAVAEPGNGAGVYRVMLHFFMAGEWELKLDFKSPRPSVLLLTDTVEVRTTAD